MRRVLLVLAVASVWLFGAKTDVYFGNGILTIEVDARANKFLLEKIIRKKLYNDDKALMKQDISKVSYAYNQTKGMIKDLLESDWQKTYLGGGQLKEEFDRAFAYIHDLTTEDLKKQIHAYNQSLAADRRVIVVAHSQGNLYAMMAAQFLSRSTDAFHVIHVASPDDHFVDDDVVGWDNDLVAAYADGDQGLIQCRVRKVRWNYIGKYGDNAETIEGFTPASNYIRKEQIASFHNENFSVEESGYVDSGTGKYNALVHAFTFYMGRPLKVDLENPTANLPLNQQKPTKFMNVPNGIDWSDLNDTSARNIILGYLSKQLEENAKVNNNPPNDSDDNATDGSSDDNATGGTDDNSTDNGSADNNDTGGSDDNNSTTDPTQDPNKVCVSNFFTYYGDGQIHDSLKKGDKDEQSYSDGTKHQVKELQEFLEAFGYDVGSSGADGWFGSDTKTALIDFQSNNDLDADGIVGPNTREVMNNTNCYDKE